MFPNKTEGDVRLWPARMEGFNGYTEHFDGQAFQMPDNVDGRRRSTPTAGYSRTARTSSRSADNGQRGGGSNRAGGGRGGGGGGRGRGARRSERLDPRAHRRESAQDRHVVPARHDRGPETSSTTSREPTPTSASRSRSTGTGEIKVQRPRSDDRQAGRRSRRRARRSSVRRAGSGGAQTWYHARQRPIRGCKPEEVAIWWDGMKRGEAKFQSILNGSMSDTDTRFSIERADDWPQRGVCWVGREAVEFERSGNTLHRDHVSRRAPA